MAAKLILLCVVVDSYRDLFPTQLPSRRAVLTDKIINVTRCFRSSNSKPSVSFQGSANLLFIKHLRHSHVSFLISKSIESIKVR
ncbi:hypothetical protein Bca101_008629 [Brassica carinata]